MQLLVIEVLLVTGERITIKSANIISTNNGATIAITTSTRSVNISKRTTILILQIILLVFMLLKL